MQLPLHPRVQAVAGVLVLVLNLAGHLGLAVPLPPVVVVVVVVVLVEDHGHAELVVELLVAAAVVDLEVGNALANADQSSKRLLRQRVDELLNLLLALRVVEPVVLQAGQHLVRRPAQDIVRLVAQLHRQQVQQVLVRSLGLTRARAVRVHVVVQAQHGRPRLGPPALHPARLDVRLALARSGHVGARVHDLVAKLGAGEKVLERLGLA
mmetsp:Transcript_32322/g.103115  ORF Transcript_32322/g.103115 Transcript_32322/m.103115 type:complete len:209 (-) Transcript_32322:149-775(-)